MDAKEDKPATDGQHINLKVKAQDGNEVFFKVKKSTPLRKLMDAYCKRQGVSEADVVFLFDGSRLKTDQTPEQLEMEDGDEIDAMVHQTGGC
mmetsp:Transcript_13384/g.22600  ORF Transcript_13384/g.22600 Transcript_13384/m.22600 type:complete len:92 (+) Transcript_13384:161-436(+)|eukprot:CAMPEP_0198208848 /NCGR_PEP_ID=MMETSP1445-20131203/12187_1 /TAXON_ID=36898 /ORGANISM="Pyramimonas sp., Strain CCMP2087" /LENGTH=91 /DNA_ID=CAMNT_0043882409 /DNA_START=113 /DNA_END=388 /DNA_ORIENTATION=+